MNTARATSPARAVVAFFTLPWAAFVAAFLYYVLVTLVAIGASQLPDLPMALAYLAPPAAYLTVLLARAVSGLASFSTRLPAAPVAAAH